MPEHWASSSRSVEGNIAELGSSFTVLEAISNDAQGEGLHLGFCLDLGGPIREHTWKFWDLGNPATILFVLELDLESHDVHFQRPSVLRRPVRPALRPLVSCIPLFGRRLLDVREQPRPGCSLLFDNASHTYSVENLRTPRSIGSPHRFIGPVEHALLV